MRIEVKGQRVSLEPIGTIIIIGSKGRINMTGMYGKVRFTLVDKGLTKPNVSVRIFESKKQMWEATSEKDGEDIPIEWDWKIMTLPPQVRYISLNEETFSESLLSVIRNA